MVKLKVLSILPVIWHLISNIHEYTTSAKFMEFYIPQRTNYIQYCRLTLFV